MTKMYVLSFRIPSGNFKVSNSCPEHFRPTKIRTSVDTVGECFIEQIVLNKDNLFVSGTGIDAYLWSMKHAQELEHEFYKEHKLIGKSIEEIQEYLDDNDLSIPEPMRIMFPTIPRNTSIEIHGKAKTDFSLMLIGRVGS